MTMGGGAEAPHDGAPKGAQSPGDINHTSYNHTSYDNSYSPAGAGFDDSKRLIYEFMTKIGIYAKIIEKTLNSYTQKFILRQIYEFEKLMRKGAIKATPGRYFLKMLESPNGN